MMSFLRKIIVRVVLASATGSALIAPASAQLRIEIAGVGSSQIPVAIAAFADEAMTPQQITSIIKDDLNRSGYFKIIEAGAVITETSPVNFDEWKKRGAERCVLAVHSLIFACYFAFRAKPTAPTMHFS